MTQDISSILSLIEEAKKESMYSIKTSEEELKFVPMNADDQKNLIKALVDSPYYSNVFNTTICEILNKCYVGDGSLFDKKLDQYDKTKLILRTRSVNIDDTVRATLKDSDGVEFEKSISIDKHLQGKFKKPTESIVEDGAYKITIDYPQLKAEYELEKYIVSNLKKINEDDQSALKGLISTIFIVNVIKYIKTLVIKETEFNFNELSTLEKLKVGSSLSSSVVKKIVGDIDGKFSKGLDELLTHNFKHKREDYSIKLNIDNTFFIT